MKEIDFSPEKISGLLFKRKREIKVFLFTFFIGFFLYIPIITQWLANPDGVWMGLVSKPYYGWDDTLGRFGQYYFSFFRNFYVFTWTQALVTILEVSIVTVLICDIFEVRHYLWCFAIGITLIVSPCLCSTLTYYYGTDEFNFSYLCVTFGVWLMVKWPNIWTVIIAASFFGISLTMYQAYIGTAIVLCFLFILFYILFKDDIKKLVRYFICFLSAGILGGIGYLCLFKVVRHFKHFVPESSRGFDSMGKIGISKIPELVKNAYSYFFTYYFTDTQFNNSWFIRRGCNIAVWIAVIALIIYFIIRRKNNHQLWKIITATILIFLLPLAFCAVIILAPEVNIINGITTILMFPHMNFAICLLIILINKLERLSLESCLKWVGCIICFFAILNYSIYIQGFQNCMIVDGNRTYTIAQTMVNRLQNLEEYHDGMKIFIAGDAVYGNYSKDYSELYSAYKNAIVETGYFWSDPNGRQYTWHEYLKHYMGVDYTVPPNAEWEAILKTEELKNMPIFPYEGSIGIINDIVVIKFSE